MENESGGFFSQKWLGLPAIVWLGGAAILAYLYFSRQSSSAQPGTSTGGGGSVKTGKTVVQSGAVKINVNGGTGGDEPQPKPKPGGGGSTKSFTVPKDESLAQFGASRNWSQDTLNVDMPAFTQPKGSTYAGQKLSPDFKLKKGDKIFRPIGN